MNMKKLLLMAASLLVLVGCQSPVLYNDSIIDPMNAYVTDFESYSATFGEFVNDGSSVEEMDIAHEKIVQSFDTMKTEIDKIWNFWDDTRFIDAANKVVAVYGEEVKELDPQLIALEKKYRNTEVSADDYQVERDRIMGDREARSEAASNEFEIVQVTFAAENGIELE